MLAPFEYYRLLSRHLLPMLAGATLDESPIAGPMSGPLVIAETGKRLLIRPEPECPFRFRITRDHPFEPDDAKIATQFVRALAPKLMAADQSFFDYLIDRCAQEVVADSVKSRIFDDNLIPLILSTMQKWAAQTYEGSRVTATIAVDSSPESALISNLHVTQIIDKDCTKVLGGGMDTMLVLSPSGHVVEHHVLTSTNPSNERAAGRLFAPLDYTSVALWAKRGRVAVSLNSYGEILVFTDRRIKFAFRRGTWFYFAHGPLVARMNYLGIAEALREAIYLTCLDSSFARTGACIALAKSDKSTTTNDLISSGDLLKSGISDKTSLLRHVVGQPFQTLPRRARQELASLDGAIVLDRSGAVLTAGAIVRVPAGSDGGGRRAAAKALSRIGFSAKISEDGGITSFTDKGPKRDPEIAFEVCI